MNMLPSSVLTGGEREGEREGEIYPLRERTISYGFPSLHGGWWREKGVKGRMKIPC
jgi:hypothetical protein